MEGLTYLEAVLLLSHIILSYNFRLELKDIVVGFLVNTLYPKCITGIFLNFPGYFNFGQGCMIIQGLLLPSYTSFRVLLQWTGNNDITTSQICDEVSAVLLCGITITTLLFLLPTLVYFYRLPYFYFAMVNLVSVMYMHLCRLDLFVYWSIPFVFTLIYLQKNLKIPKLSPNSLTLLFCFGMYIDAEITSLVCRFLISIQILLAFENICENHLEHMLALTMPMWFGVSKFPLQFVITEYLIGLELLHCVQWCQSYKGAIFITQTFPESEKLIFPTLAIYAVQVSNSFDMCVYHCIRRKGKN